MELEVRLFAILRERAGTGSLRLELADGATVADALAAAAREPGLAETLARMPVRAALNREYVAEDAPIAPGDELALIPPVSGGATAPPRARITDSPLSVFELASSVARPGAGAVVVFCGITREVERLEYEAYAEMAGERIERILDECLRAHGLEAAAAEHRVGSVPLGEPSVVVAVSAAHRGEAFAGAREAIDRIKSEAPIFKREVEGGEERWVEGEPPPLADEASRAGTTAGPRAGATAGPSAGATAGPRAGATAGPSAEGPARLTHIDDAGRARMVDVGAKPETARHARAEARVRMAPATSRALARGDSPKGDVLGTARIAGIGAAKRTGELIPLAHPLGLDFIDVEGEVDAEAGLVRLSAEAGTTGRTGVEMEAMTACAVAALTVYDMVKGLERGVSIEAIELVRKSGGRSGEWRR